MKLPRIVRTVLHEHARLYDLAHSVRRRLLGAPDPVRSFFEEVSRRAGGRVSFIQIGANDGLGNDPIREFVVREPWTGVLVEPVPSAFAALCRNYAYLAGSRLHFLNAAVASESGTLAFWTYSDAFLTRLPRLEQQDLVRKSSFSREHVVRWVPDGFSADDALEEIKVSCMTLDEIQQTYGIERLDLLIIDAEGHEAQILSTISALSAPPKAIFFEYHNLRDRKLGVYSQLASRGYVLREVGGDCGALLPE